MEIKIIRKGKCLQCGYCCSGCIHLKPEFIVSEQGKYSCDIYSNRNTYCSKCGIIHHCDFDDPVSPLRGENPKCGFRFYEDYSGAEVLNIVRKDNEWVRKNGN